MSHPHILGNVGTVFRATIKDQDNEIVDVTLSTTKEIIFRKPDGSLISRAATFTNSGSDGKIEYKTQSADIDQVGTWEWQPHVILGAGNEWYSDPIEFVVKEKLVAV